MQDVHLVVGVVLFLRLAFSFCSCFGDAMPFSCILGKHSLCFVCVFRLVLSVCSVLPWMLFSLTSFCDKMSCE